MVQQLFQASARSGTRVMGRRPSSASCCPAVGDLKCAENNKQTRCKAMAQRSSINHNIGFGEKKKLDVMLV